MKKLIQSVSLSYSFWTGYRLPDTNIRLEIMTEDHLEDGVGLIAQNFCDLDTEPLSSNIPKTGEGSLTSLFTEVVSGGLDQEMSLVAFDEDQNDLLVAILTAQDLHTPVSDELGEIVEKNEHFHPIFDILGILDDFYEEHASRHGLENLLYISCLASHESVWGKSVVKEMVSQVEIIAKEKGFEAMFTECTNWFSMQIFGEECILMKVKYDNYVFVDGTRPFLGCNEVAENSLKEDGLYKDKFKGCCEFAYLVEKRIK